MIMAGIHTTCDVEYYVDLGLDEVAEMGSFANYIDFVAEQGGYPPLIEDIDTQPVAINPDGTIHIRVTGRVPVEDADAEDVICNECGQGPDGHPDSAHATSCSLHPDNEAGR